MMPSYGVLDVSQETTAICVVDDAGRTRAEKKDATCPEAIGTSLNRKAPDLVRVGLETGQLAVWLWNELAARRLPILSIDARHATAALKMRPRGSGAGPTRHARMQCRTCSTISRYYTTQSASTSGTGCCYPSSSTGNRKCNPGASTKPGAIQSGETRSTPTWSANHNYTRWQAIWCPGWCALNTGSSRRHRSNASGHLV
jgi:hypothetical protein